MNAQGKEALDSKASVVPKTYDVLRFKETSHRRVLGNECVRTTVTS